MTGRKSLKEGLICITWRYLRMRLIYPGIQAMVSKVFYSSTYLVSVCRSQDAGTVAPPSNSTMQPIGKQSAAPGPIRPANSQNQGKSMADLLFKKKPAPVQPPPATTSATEAGRSPSSAAQSHTHSVAAPSTPGSYNAGGQGLVGKDTVHGTNGYGPAIATQVDV